MWRVESRANNWDEESGVGRVRASPRGLAALFLANFQQLGQAGCLGGKKVPRKQSVQAHPSANPLCTPWSSDMNWALFPEILGLMALGSSASGAVSVD